MATPPGYTFEQSKDTLYDIRKVSDWNYNDGLTQLADACNADPSCWSFNTDGVLKTLWFSFTYSPAHSHTLNYCWGLYIKQGEPRKMKCDMIKYPLNVLVYN